MNIALACAFFGVSLFRNITKGTLYPSCTGLLFALGKANFLARALSRIRSRIFVNLALSSAISLSVARLLLASDAPRKPSTARPVWEGFELSTIWEGIKFDVAHIRDIDRVAVVTDVGWIGGLTRALCRVSPLEIRVFDMAELEAARAWVEAP